MAKSANLNYGRIMAYAGTFIAFLIGSGFATGQEVVQYFSAYGWYGILGIVVVFTLFLYVARQLVSIGYQQKFEHNGQIYRYLCGPVFGRFFDYFAIVFIYMSFIVMIGGAGATVQQQYDISPWYGAVLMGFFAATTVICGLNRIVSILGKVGPFIVLITVILGLASIAKNPTALMSVNDILPNLNVMKASGHWLFAALSYVGFCMLWLAGFMSLMGSSAKNLKEISRGVALGAAGFSLALCIITLGLMANMEQINVSMVPSLTLAMNIHPVFAGLFFVIVIAGIYTTAVPLLWQAAKRFTGQNQKAFVMVTIFLSILGVVIGLKVPFDRLVNVIYVLNGYIGFVLLFFMVVHSVKNMRPSKNHVTKILTENK